jgi:hypothetical protein
VKTLGRTIRFRAFRERFRNVFRAAVGMALVVIGVGVISLTIDNAERRRTLTARAPDTPASTLPEPPSAPPPLNSRFPAVPTINGRSDVEVSRDARIRGLFSPFTGSGEMNFVRGHRELVRTDGRAPLSYRWLRDAGKLERVEAFVGVATDPENDRPLWPRPQTPADWEAARGLLVLYMRLGPLWDDEG